MNPIFQHQKYLLMRQVFALTGKFRFYDPRENLVMFSEQKMFKLKEDIRVYDSPEKNQELLWIKARQVIDFSASYDVFDPLGGSSHIGVLRRKGWRSIARDEWQILGPQEYPLGIIIEDSLGYALLRRFLLGSLLPQNYDVLVDNQRVADLHQRFNIFRYEMDIDLRPDIVGQLDPRLAIAAALLLGTIEGKQSS